MNLRPVKDAPDDGEDTLGAGCARQPIDLEHVQLLGPQEDLGADTIGECAVPGAESADEGLPRQAITRRGAGLRRAGSGQEREGHRRKKDPESGVSNV